MIFSGIVEKGDSFLGGSLVSGFSSLSRFSRFSSISSLSRFHGKSGISWYILPLAPQKAVFHFALLSPCTSLEKIGCGSEEAKTKNAVFHFALLSPCTIFREDRLRLGRGKNEKRCFSFCSSLALHYLCPHFSYIYIYLRLW